MAGGRRGGATGAFTVAGKFNPVPEYAVTFVRDYDIKGIGAMLAKASPCSMEEQIELFRKVRSGSIDFLTRLASVSFGFQDLVYPIWSFGRRIVARVVISVRGSLILKG